MKCKHSNVRQNTNRKVGELPLVMETRNEVCDNSVSAMASEYSTLRSILVAENIIVAENEFPLKFPMTCCLTV